MLSKSFRQFFNEGCGLRHSDEENTLEVKDIGYANSWNGNPPAEYVAHQKNCCETVSPRPDYSYQKCPVVTKKIGRNLEEVTCKKCGIQWKVDSSG